MVLGRGILVAIRSEVKFSEKFATLDCPLTLRKIIDEIVEWFLLKVNYVMFDHKQEMPS